MCFGDPIYVNHAMNCMKSGFILQRHKKIKDLEAVLLNLVCKHVETEPVLQEITEDILSQSANMSQDARVDIHARGFWEGQRSAFFDNIQVILPGTLTGVQGDIRCKVLAALSTVK